MQNQLPQPAGASPHKPEFQFDPWIIWVTFRRCWPWAVPVGAVFAGIVAFGVLQTFIPRYKASAMLAADDGPLLFKGIVPTVDDLARTEKAFIMYPIVLNEVLDNSSLRKAPSLSDPETAEANLRKNLSVSSGGSKKRIVISYVDTDRVAASEVCNAVVDSYLRRRSEFDSARVNDLEQWLLPEIDKWEHQVEEHERKVQQLSKATLGYAPGQRAAMIEDENHLALVTDLKKQITELEVSLTLFDAEAKKSAAQPKNEKSDTPPPAFVPPEITVERVPPTESDVDVMVLQDERVQEAIKMVDSHKKTLFQLSQNGLDKIRSDYKADQEEKRDEWTKRLNDLKSSIRPEIAAELNAKADEAFDRAKRDAELQTENARKQFYAEIESEKQRQAEEAIAAKQAKTDERDSMVGRLDALKVKYENERTRLEGIGMATAELQFAYDDLEVAKGVLVKLRDRVAAIRTERQRTASVRTLAPATPPKNPVEAVPVKKLVAMSGLAFLIPFAFGLLWEFRIQRVTDSNAVEKCTALAPVVGEVAKLPSGSAGGSKGRRLFEESIDTLRANLFLSVDTQHSRSIAVASSMSGEGKSSVASQLAISIAKATGETVLLIDADLRCPDQHEIFGLDMGPGLSGVLQEEATLAEAVNTSLGDLIHVLPAGRLNSSPHRLMSQPAMRRFLDDVLRDYSYVVIDTAPVLSAGETLAVSSVVDSTLLCVMRDVSRMECVNKTTRRLAAAGANIAGTVFSGVTARQYAYRYGDYHYAIAGDVPNS